MSVSSRTRGKTLALAIAATVVGCALSGSCAFAQPNGSVTQPGGFTRVWGALWYLRGTHDVDDLTLVYGGVEGSSALVYRDTAKNKSFWVFLEGTSMDVSFGQVSPPDQQTSVPGEMIVSSYPNLIEAPKEANKRQLTYQLIDVYGYSQGTTPVIRHAPFLMGKGWENSGATWAEAQSVCASLDITVTLTAVSPSNGRVIFQSLDGGKLLDGPPPFSMQVTLQVDPPPSTTMAVLAAPAGTGWADAIPVVPSAGASSAEAAGSLTPAHTNFATSPILGAARARSDLVFRLPDAAAGEVVTVTQVEGADRLALTAWKLDAGSPQILPGLGATNAATMSYRPSLRLYVPSTNCFLTVEWYTRNLGDVKLRFEW